MARGESVEVSDKGSGIAIWAVFGAACLLATFLVVWATSESTEEDPYREEEREPFVGAEAALNQLGWRDCGLPTGTPDESANALHDVLVARGYAAQGEWGAPEPLPLARSFPELHGACGVVVVRAQPGMVLTDLGAEKRPSCSMYTASIGACGADEVRAEGHGTGDIQTRVYLMPGLTEQAVVDSGAPVDALLGHAEAEVMLATLGWTPGDDVLFEEVTAARGTGTYAPPQLPSNGCVPWVVVGIGMSHASTTWIGRSVDNDVGRTRFQLGLIGCGGTGMMGARRTELYAQLEGSPPGFLYFRPYTIGAPAGARTVTIGEATFADSSVTVTLPRPVEDRVDD